MTPAYPLYTSEVYKVGEKGERSIVKKIILYVILTFLLSTAGYYALIHSKTLGFSPVFLMFYLMWCPAMSAIMVSILPPKDFSGLGFKLCKAHWLGLGYFLPVVYAGLAYGIIWVFGFGGINPDYPFHPFKLFLFGTFFHVAFAAGEEIGWRGFLVPQLYKRMSFTATCLVTGLIWSVWHFPLILSGIYLAKMPVLPQLVLLVVTVTAMTFPISWLRLRSQSVWPAILLHASHNLYIQWLFDPLTTETSVFSKYMIGESGIVMAVIFAVMAWIFASMGRPLPKETGDHRLN